ncbi:rhodanese-like domain-containing protein [Cytobacillus dafuensis]|nr:hypothetical protein [Cytobacillus dafuensis]
MLYFIIMLLAIITGTFFLRYFPVGNVKCKDLYNINKDSLTILDVRDYNLSYNDPIQGAKNIPVAYLKRNYAEIPSLSVHIIAADHLEKNISIRFLRKRGFKITGYTLTGCKCKEKLSTVY